ncbi:MAG: HD domain-containing protein [Magnetococcales bacterium]|nr:HD domain-containing protein [Magnetococcales bacterium]
MPLNNIEDDLSSVHELKEGEFHVTDPQLLTGMVFKTSIREGSVNLVTANTPITAGLLEKLQAKGVENIEAKYYVPEEIESAADNLNKVFQRTEDFLVEHNIQTTDDAISILRESGRMDTVGFNQEALGLIEQIVQNLPQLAAEGIRDLDKHDQNTTLHSVETALISLKIGEMLGWSHDKLIQLGTAAVLHDVGKVGIGRELLAYTGKYNEDHWKEMQTHTLIGYLMLSDGEQNKDLSAYCAGVHHEYYKGRSARAYGLLTSHAGEIERDLKSEFNKDDKLMAEVITIADVHSALCEDTSYKNRKLPVEIATIMNLEAKHGKFNTKIYRTWYQLFRRRNPWILQKGHCFPLTSTQRMKLARQLKKRMVVPMVEERLSFEELNRLGILPRLFGDGVRATDIKRRNGVTLFELKKRRISGIPLDFNQFDIQIEKPVSYNVVVIDPLSETRAMCMLIKEGDTIKDLQYSMKRDLLDPIQKYLLSRRDLEMDFHKEVMSPFD